VLTVYKNGLSIKIDGHTQWVKLVEMMTILFSIQYGVVLTSLTLWVGLQITYSPMMNSLIPTLLRTINSF
jgi:hypothetical protein